MPSSLFIVYIVLNDSNPGEISMSTGGVGRNIAENLSRISIPSKMFSYDIHLFTIYVFLAGYISDKSEF